MVAMETLNSVTNGIVSKNIVSKKKKPEIFPVKSQSDVVYLLKVRFVHIIVTPYFVMHAFYVSLH